VAAAANAFLSYEARKVVASVVVSAVATILLTLLLPWSPVSPWRTPARLGGCPQVTVYTPDATRYHAYEAALRRAMRRRYPATTVLVVTGDAAANLRRITTATCAAAISEPVVVAQGRIGAGQWRQARLTTLWILGLVWRDGTIPAWQARRGVDEERAAPSDWLVADNRADPDMITFLKAERDPWWCTGEGTTPIAADAPVSIMRRGGQAARPLLPPTSRAPVRTAAPARRSEVHSTASPPPARRPTPSSPASPDQPADHQTAASPRPPRPSHRAGRTARRATKHRRGSHQGGWDPAANRDEVPEPSDYAGQNWIRYCSVPSSTSSRSSNWPAASSRPLE